MHLKRDVPQNLAGTKEVIVVGKRDISIVGYGETPVVLRGGRSSYDLAGDVFAQIIETTGIDKSEIDGICVSETMSETSNPFWAVYMAEMLGIESSWTQVNGLGGASTISGVARAASAIRDGLCTTVLVLASDAQSSFPPTEQGAYRWEFQYPHGLRGPVGVFGMLTKRYDIQYGLKDEALAKLAVTQRNHALMNPNAVVKLQKPITEEDYLNSKYVSEPLRMLDSVMVCDGANGVLVTSTENAERLGLEKRVYPTAYSEFVNFDGNNQTPDITETGFSIAGPKALAQAGLKPQDIQLFTPYDDFLIAIILQLEQIGFCGRGEGSDFVLETDMSYAGTLPLNTGGGQISAGQPGLAGGGLNFVEAVRQLFGEAGERQVQGVSNALVTGIGSIPYGRNWATSNVLVLEQ